MKTLIIAKKVASILWVLVIAGACVFIISVMTDFKLLTSPTDIPPSTRIVIFCLLGPKILAESFVMGRALLDTKDIVKPVSDLGKRSFVFFILLLLLAPLVFDQYFASLMQIAFFSLLSIIVGFIFLIISTWIWGKILR